MSNIPVKRLQKGIVTLQKRDATTGEVTWEHTQENIMTVITDRNLFHHPYFSLFYDTNNNALSLETNVNSLVSSTTNRPTRSIGNTRREPITCLLLQPIADDAFGVTSLNGKDFIGPSEVIDAVSDVSWNVTETAELWSAVRRDRYAAPTSDREIFGVALGLSNLTGSRGTLEDTQAISAYVAISTPCIQTTAEVLDVYYRIEMDLNETAELADGPDFFAPGHYDYAELMHRTYCVQGTSPAGTIASSNWGTRFEQFGNWGTETQPWWGPVPSDDGSKYTTYPSITSFVRLAEGASRTSAISGTYNVSSNGGSSTGSWMCTIPIVSNAPTDTNMLSYVPKNARPKICWEGYPVTFGTNWYVGMAIRSQIGGVLTDARRAASDVMPHRRPSTAIGGRFIFPALPSDFPHKPVQPIHNHSEGAPGPFQDVDTLASGGGKLSVNGDNWTEQTGHVEFNRIDIVAGGQVGTAKYSVKRSLRSGFHNNSYWDDIGGDIPALINTRDPFTGLTRTKTIVDGNVYKYELQNLWTAAFRDKVAKYSHNDSRNTNATEWIDAKTIITFDDDGITLFDAIQQTYENFDATSTPALLTTDIVQTAVTADGTIWVADKAEGLFSIADPKGVASITTHDTLDGDLDHSKCYGVCEGYNDSIWAVFEGGIAHTTDAGTTWTVYKNTDNSFTHLSYEPAEQIGPGNWDSIRMIKADVSSQDHDIALVRYSPAHPNNTTHFPAVVVWWKPGQMAFDQLNGLKPDQWYCTNMLVSDGGKARVNNLKCSRKGSTWLLTNFLPQSTFDRFLHPKNHRYGKWGDAQFAELSDGQPQNKSFSGNYSPSTYTPYDEVIANTGQNWQITSANVGSVWHANAGLQSTSFVYDGHEIPYVACTMSQPAVDSTGSSSNTAAGAMVDIVDREMFSVTRNASIDVDQYSQHFYNFGVASVDFVFERAHCQDKIKVPHISVSGFSPMWRNLYPQNQLTGRDVDFSVDSYNRNSAGSNRYYTIGSSHPPYDASVVFPGIDSLYGKHTVNQEWQWMDYRWNGSDWVQDYHAPLVDITGNAHNGFRKNFDVESNRFTSRSAIDISAVLSEDFTTGMTLAGTYNFEPRPLRSKAQHTLFSTELFSVGRSGNNITMKSLHYPSELFPHTFASETDNRIVTTIEPHGNQFDFNLCSHGTKFFETGVLAKFVDDTIVTTNKNTIGETNQMYHTLYSPVYDEIAGGDTAIRFKLNVPTTAGPGRGMRFGIRYGDREFIPALDTFHDATAVSGLADFGGFRSPNTVNCYLPGGTAAPVFTRGATILTAAAGSALEADDQNGINRLELRYTISGSDLVITLKRIEDAGAPVDETLYTVTIPSAGTDYTATKGIIGITPEWSNIASANSHEVTDFELYDYSTASSFGNTNDGAKINVYVNDTQVVTDYVISKPVLASTKMLMGYQAETMDRGFVGTMSNPQVWNVVWDGSDITADAANPTGALNTGTAPTAALKARYDMAAALSEAKVTHLDHQPLPQGTTIAFDDNGTNGTTTHAFVATDYYTFCVFDGMVKDNAIEYSHGGQRVYTRPRDAAFTDCQDATSPGSQVTTVPNNVGIEVTEPAIFVYDSDQAYHGIHYGKSYAHGASGANRIRVAQHFPANTDGSFKGMIVVRGSWHMVMTTNLNTHPTPDQAVGHTTGCSIQFLDNGQFICRSNGNTAVYTSAVGAYEAGDWFEIRRTNTDTTPTFEFVHNDVVVHSHTAGVQTDAMAVMLRVSGNPDGFKDCTVTYTRHTPSVDLGFSEPANTGKYSPVYMQFDDVAFPYKMTIDGIPVDKANIRIVKHGHDTIPANLTEGFVEICPYSGVIFFSPDDIGKNFELQAAALITWE